MDASAQPLQDLCSPTRTPGFRLAASLRFDELLRLVGQDAEMLLDRDPELTSRRGRSVPMLLALFGRDDAWRALHSG
jgi:ATP-dependent DNA helicase RecG